MADETKPASEQGPAAEVEPTVDPKTAEAEPAVDPTAAEGDQRRWPRVKLDARVVVSYPNLVQLVSGPLSDISLGGLFIRTPSVRPIGTPLTLKVIARDETLEFEAHGRVVRVVRPEDAGPDGLPVPGMGIEFDKLMPETRSALKRLIEVATQRDQAAP